MSIFIIRSSSGSISLILLSKTILDLIIIFIQYLHSEASFKRTRCRRQPPTFQPSVAMEYFNKKSARDWANLASARAHFVRQQLRWRIAKSDSSNRSTTPQKLLRQCFCSVINSCVPIARKPHRGRSPKCFLLSCT